ncbi:hypothetical protein F4819DRAFT_452448 [Hypoxylon fuscum]|nr:hypothetical protein F4819DRAFT_452448 [Hypoxylon fuscum]
MTNTHRFSVMTSDFSRKRVNTLQEVEIDGRNTERISDINFVPKSETKLFCYSTAACSPVTNTTGQWCNRSTAIEFLHALSRTFTGNEKEKTQQPTFTLIGGYGNGTLHPLSVDCELFEQIITVYRLPGKVREMVRSIHGVCGRFVEYKDDKKSLLILFSTPKAPVREILCGMRYDLATSSFTCLIFDASLSDLDQTIKTILRSPSSRLVQQNPVAYMTVILQQCGLTSERRRQALDDNILGAEVLTKSTPWSDPSIAVVQRLNNFYEATSILHLSYNNLIFVYHAISFEINTWKLLRTMAEDQRVRPMLQARASDNEWQSMLDDIDFELGLTTCRKAQVECLKERTTIQINVMNNVIAHRTTSQTNLITLLALVFAPASLIAGIFSAGIFETNERSWVAYIASTVPVTFATVVVGLLFLEKQKMAKTWHALRGAAKQNEISDRTGRVRFAEALSL